MCRGQMKGTPKAEGKRIQTPLSQQGVQQEREHGHFSKRSQVTHFANRAIFGLMLGLIFSFILQTWEPTGNQTGSQTGIL